MEIVSNHHMAHAQEMVAAVDWKPHGCIPCGANHSNLTLNRRQATNGQPVKCRAKQSSSCPSLIELSIKRRRVRVHNKPHAYVSRWCMLLLDMNGAKHFGQEGLKSKVIKDTKDLHNLCRVACCRSNPRRQCVPGPVLPLPWPPSSTPTPLPFPRGTLSHPSASQKAKKFATNHTSHITIH